MGQIRVFFILLTDFVLKKSTICFFNMTKIVFTPFFQKVKFGTIFVVLYFYLAVDEENTSSKVILCINQKTRNIKDLVCKYTSTKVKRKGCLNHTEKLNKCR